MYVGGTILVANGDDDDNSDSDSNDDNTQTTYITVVVAVVKSKTGGTMHCGNYNILYTPKYIQLCTSSYID